MKVIVLRVVAVAAVVAVARAASYAAAVRAEAEAEAVENADCLCEVDAEGWRCEGDCDPSVACPFCNPE